MSTRANSLLLLQSLIIVRRDKGYMYFTTIDITRTKNDYQDNDGGWTSSLHQYPDIACFYPLLG